MAAQNPGSDAADAHVDTSLLKLPGIQAEDKKVATGEENEEEIYCHRAKLFRQSEGEWKERCKGDLRLMKDKADGRVRVVMREDIMESLLRANHIVPPDAELASPPGVENMVFYSAVDVSDGDATPTTFLVKMRNAEVIAGFKAVWDSAREANKAVLKGNSGPAAAAAGSGPVVAAAPKGTAVTVTSDLSVIYGAGNVGAAQRVDKLEAAFEAKYGSTPAFFVRAPGRVNVIGEHVDYHGYGVLPFAIAEDVMLAVGTAEGAGDVQASSTDGQFPDGSFAVDPTAAVPPVGAPADWTSYLQCGFKAAFATAGAAGVTPSKGLRVLVDSTVPTAAGVSSSSALVVAGALAAVHAYGLGTPMNLELARVTRDAEQEVGTLSGGMDQAASLLGQAGNALHITFAPHLAGTRVPLPLNAVFLLAKSGVPAPKAEGAATGYNLRVVEGALGVKLVAKKEGKAGWKDMSTMQALQASLGLGSSSPAEAEVFLNSLPPTPVTVAALESEEYFGCPLADLFPAGDAAVAAVLAGGADTVLSLKDRLVHVVREADRVGAAVKALLAGSETTLAEVGGLMDASHASCVEQYDCSCPELDALVAAAKAGGAVGARLVGAGWGGCIVALAQMGQVEAVKEALATQYYAAHGKADLAESGVLAVVPSFGAAVYLPADEEEL